MLKPSEVLRRAHDGLAFGKIHWGRHHLGWKNHMDTETYCAVGSVLWADGRGVGVESELLSYTFLGRSSRMRRTLKYLYQALPDPRYSTFRTRPMDHVVTWNDTEGDKETLIQALLKASKIAEEAGD